MKNKMENKEPIKIPLNIVIFIVGVVIVAVVSIFVAIYLKKYNHFGPMENNISGYNEPIVTQNPISSNEKICTINGTNSKLLYKNNYETDISYGEKVIFIDDEAKNNMIFSNGTLDANQVLYIGAFKGEFIDINYSTNAIQDFEMALAYIEDGKFYKCETNKLVKRAFNKNKQEIDVPKLEYPVGSYEDNKIPDNISTVYALFDITNKEGIDYIIGTYNEVFADNPNYLTVKVVLKKENVNIDLNDEKQIENFWNKFACYEIENIKQTEQKNYEEVSINGQKYYHLLNTDTWKGQYNTAKYYTANENNIKRVVSYNDYIKYINEINSSVIENKITNYYDDKDSNYIILSYANGHGWCELDLIDCIEENNKIVIYGKEYSKGVMASGSGYLTVIPTNMPVDTEIEYRQCYSTQEISNLKNYGNSETRFSLDKPIIYLYPTNDTNVTVRLGKAELTTCTYPKYDYKNGWKVLAKPNGNLVDLTTNRNLYALYYESTAKYEYKIKDDGFIVKSTDTAKFLEEKLSILGLTEREAEEFIVYWIPKLEKNKYNYIRFATLDEINANMPLEIKPKPDIVIRVMMTYKGLENPINVREQYLNTPERKGFVAVEWGGTEIK